MEHDVACEKIFNYFYKSQEVVEEFASLAPFEIKVQRNFHVLREYFVPFSLFSGAVYLVSAFNSSALSTRTLALINLLI